MELFFTLYDLLEHNYLDFLLELSSVHHYYFYFLVRIESLTVWIINGLLHFKLWFLIYTSSLLLQYYALWSISYSQYLTYFFIFKRKYLMQASEFSIKKYCLYKRISKFFAVSSFSMNWRRNPIMDHSIGSEIRRFFQVLWKYCINYRFIDFGYLYCTPIQQQRMYLKIEKVPTQQHTFFYNRNILFQWTHDYITLQECA